MVNIDIDYDKITSLFNKDLEGCVDDSAGENGSAPTSQPPTLERDEEFLREINEAKKSKKVIKNQEMEDGKVKEILLLKESQLGIVNYYLNSFHMEGFKYFEGTSHYKTISNLKENLLNDPYWVIATLGRKHSLKVPKYKFNYDVIDKYLNHIIISNNWNLLNDMDKDTFTIQIDFHDKIYTYKVRFLASLDEDILSEYIKSRLVGHMNNFQIERVTNFLFANGKKNLVENLEKFISMKGYSFEEVAESIKMEKNISFLINELVGCIIKKKKRKWREHMAGILHSHGEKYVVKALQNNFEALYKLKVGDTVNALNKNFLKTLINQVDMLDLTYLKSIFEEKEFVSILLNLEEYMNKSVKEIIIR